MVFAMIRSNITKAVREYTKKWKRFTFFLWFSPKRSKNKQLKVFFFIANSIDLYWHWIDVALNCMSATLGWVSTNLSQCDTVVIRGSNTVTIQNPNNKSKLYWTNLILNTNTSVSKKFILDEHQQIIEHLTCIFLYLFFLYHKIKYIYLNIFVFVCIFNAYFWNIFYYHKNADNFTFDMWLLIAFWQKSDS